MNRPFMIASHFSNDDPRHFSFVRQSGLPYGTFGRPRHLRATRWAFIVAGVMALAIVAAFIVEFAS